MPNLKCNLISVSQLLNNSNLVIQLTNKICSMQDLNLRNLIGVGEQREGLYFLKGVTSVHACKVDDMESFELWHKRMGHPSSKVVELIPEAGKMVRKTNKTCEVCFRAKQTRGIFFSSDNKAKDCFELMHCDLWGPYRVLVSCGAIYFLTVVDDYSCAVWIYLLNGKNEVACVLRKFIAMVKCQFEKNVKIVRSDNGSEFLCLKNILMNMGYCIKLLVLEHLHKMAEWKESIAISLMLQELCACKQIYS